MVKKRTAIEINLVIHPRQNTQPDFIKFKFLTETQATFLRWPIRKLLYPCTISRSIVMLQNLFAFVILEEQEKPRI